MKAEWSTADTVKAAWVGGGSGSITDGWKQDMK